MLAEIVIQELFIKKIVSTVNNCYNMETWVIILNSVMIISIILCVVMVIIVNNRNSYCAIFMYKDRKLWKYLIENAFQFNQTNEIEKSIWFEWNNYELFVQKNDELVSVFKNDECILSYFDYKMSKKMYNTLKELGKI